MTNQPDAELLASDLSTRRPGRGCSCLPIAFKGVGVLMMAFGGFVLLPPLIGTIVFGTPMNLNGQPRGKLESVAIEVGFLVMWFGFGALWFFVIGKMYPGRQRYWRLNLGDDLWVLRQGKLGWILGQASPREIERLAVDRRGRVVAETTTGKSQPITGPMLQFEWAWALRVLCGLLSQSSGASRVAESTSYPYVPAVDPAALPGSTLKYRLSRIDRPWRNSLGCLAVTLFWNGFTWAFVWAKLSGINPQWEGWKGWLILIPLNLAGVAALAILAMNLYQSINDTRAGAASVEVSICPLEPGERCKVFISGQAELTAMVVRLVCKEEVQYGTGSDENPYSTESKRVRALELYRGEGLPPVDGLPFETNFEFEVPADAMHSLEVEKNKITWMLELEGGSGDPPKFHREFAIVINPARSSRAVS
jgi:hypothetical protein